MEFSIKVYQCFDFIPGTCTNQCRVREDDLAIWTKYCAWTGRYVRFSFSHERITLPEPEFKTDFN